MGRSELMPLAKVEVRVDGLLVPPKDYTITAHGVVTFKRPPIAPWRKRALCWLRGLPRPLCTVTVSYTWDGGRE